MIIVMTSLGLTSSDLNSEELSKGGGIESRPHFAARARGTNTSTIGSSFPDTEERGGIFSAVNKKDKAVI